MGVSMETEWLEPATRVPGTNADNLMIDTLSEARDECS